MSALDLSQVARRVAPIMPDNMQVATDNGRGQDLTKLAVRPNDPRIPPPDGPPEPPTPDDDAIDAAINKVTAEMRAGRPVENIVGAAKPALAASRRITISYGPEPEKLVLVVEEAPEWDVLDDGSFLVSVAAVKELLPILRHVVKVKSLVPGL